METLRHGLPALLLLIGLVSSALAGDGKSDRSPTGSASTARPTLTGKERLGPKWTDEQRLDNCNVPVGKRGTKPRPEACSNGAIN
jgi:hypothetical protein